MSLCQYCEGEIPQEARADAIYCSPRCKLKAQRIRKKAALSSSTESVPSTTDTASASSAPSTPVSTTQQTEPASPELTPTRRFDPVLPFNHTEQLAFPFGPGSTVAASAQIRTDPSPAAVPVENTNAHQSVQASAPAASRVAIPPPISSPRPSPTAVAPAVPTTSSPPVTMPPTTPNQAAQSIGECLKMIIQHVKDTERRAEERRAKETPEERQRREQEDARALRRLKQFDRFI